MKWTEEETLLLKRLWQEGLTASEIGYRTNRSRNAIIGRLHRVHLSDRDRPRKKPPEKPVVEKVAAKPAGPIIRQKSKTVWDAKLGVTYVKGPTLPRLRTPPPPIDVVDPSIPQVGILGVAAGHCKFPVNEGKPFIFCNQLVREKSSFCPDHHAMVWRPPDYFKSTPQQVLLPSASASEPASSGTTKG